VFGSTAISEISDAYVESLPEWYDSTDEKSAKVVVEGEVSGSLRK
jgi:hypothetical protein